MKNEYPLAPVTVFGDVNVHSDLWATGQLGNVFKEIDIEDPEFETALEVTCSLKDNWQQLIATRDTRIEDFYDEIVDQSGSFDHYFHNILSINPHSQPQTSRLISLGITVAGIVGMHWKLKLNKPRPAQLFPGIFPLLPTPAHPTYPSNHATQSYTAAGLLTVALEGGVGDVFVESLERMAKRISKNRERAGLHLHEDTLAGMELARVLVRKLQGVDIVGQDLLPGCRHEIQMMIEGKNG